MLWVEPHSRGRLARLRKRRRCPGSASSAALKTPAQMRFRIIPFKQQLQALGWIEGRNVEIDYRHVSATGKLEMAATDLVATKPDVVMVMPTPAVQAIWRATRSIPVVFANVADPVEGGFVASDARPGGNMTGFTSFEYSLGGKWLELLKEICLQRDGFWSFSCRSTIPPVDCYGLLKRPDRPLESK